MQRNKTLNRALVIVGALILVLGITLALTVPQDVKDFAGVCREKVIAGEWGPGRASGDAGAWDGPRRFGRYGRLPLHPGFFFLGGAAGIVLFTGVVALAAVCLIRFLAGARGFGRGRSSALDLLREKYAAGDMNKEEFFTRRRVLENERESE